MRAIYPATNLERRQLTCQELPGEDFPEHAMPCATPAGGSVIALPPKEAARFLADQAGSAQSCPNYTPARRDYAQDVAYPQVIKL